ncbi:MAG: L,D-transpeptidase family protein, partial [Shimia sp.]|nr:L,D-transpeptidase family protein [Shimia sp.]
GESDYNHHVQAPYGPSHEKLRRADPLYDMILLTDWNWPNAEPGKGSAIFLHTWRRRGYPTEGCIGFRRDHMTFVARHAAPGTRVIVP